MDREVLRGIVDRSPLNDDGRSGAVLERVSLADGSRVVVKHFDPTVDLVMRLSGDPTGREVELVRRGVFDGLPATVLHPVIDAWYDDGRGVLGMRDLGDAVLTWKSIVSRDQARTMFAVIADLHAAFLGSAPDALTPLDLLLGLFEPRRLRPYAGSSVVDYALRGWEYWPEVAPGEVGERVLALAQDAGPSHRCLPVRCPSTLLHGDLATVDMAFEPDRPGCLTLIDWGLVAAGLAELDIGRLLAGCAQLFGHVGREASATIVARLDGLIALQREVAGPAYDDAAVVAAQGGAGPRDRPRVKGQEDGREHAVPPDRRVLRRPGQRGEGRPVGGSHAVHRVDGA